MSRTPRRERVIDAAIFVLASIALLNIVGLHEGFTLGGIVVLNVVLLFRAAQPDIDQINLNISPDVWIREKGIIDSSSEWVLYRPRKKGRKAIHADDLYRAWSSAMGDIKLPLTINFGSRRITVVVERYEQEKLSVLPVSPPFYSDTAPNSRGGLSDIESQCFGRESCLPVADSVTEPNTDKAS